MNNYTYLNYLDAYTNENHQHLSEFVCNICSKIYSNQKVDSAGNIFCNSCAAKSAGKGFKSKVKVEYNPVKYLETELDKQSVYCFNKNKGCMWVGEKKSQIFHSERCDKAEVLCNLCTQPFCKDEIINHKAECKFREVLCNRCLKTYQLNSNHTITCEKVQINCECGEIVFRGDYSKHRRNYCEFAMINCPYSFELNPYAHTEKSESLKKLSCTTQFLRKDLKSHVLEETSANIHLEYLSALNCLAKETLEIDFIKKEEK